MKIKLIILCLAILLIFGCAQTQVKQPIENEPAVISTPTKTSDTNDDVDPTKGGESDEDETPEKETDPEIQALLEKGKNVKSLFYKYKGPETNDDFYDFYVKGGNIKYLPYRAQKSLDREEGYNAIYLDKPMKTAESYCDDRICKFKGKKEDLDYDENYILTPSDWLGLITYAEKIGDELIEKRKTWKLQANGDTTVWVDLFYGTPMQIMQGSNKYEFTKMTFNSVKDSEVIPQE